jgi:hypothetical protein
MNVHFLLSSDEILRPKYGYPHQESLQRGFPAR